MKKVAFLILLACFSIKLFAQQELRIHHINVENGDATLIGIYDPSLKKYTSTMLIDGGDENPEKYLLPYLRRELLNAVPTVNYVALTHYHSDHYNGLLALATGHLQADSLIDPSGYDLNQMFPDQKNFRVAEPAPLRLLQKQTYLSAIKAAVERKYLKGHAANFISYGNTGSSGIGKSIYLGMASGNPVQITCIGGWGNTPDGHRIIPDPIPGRDNPNNFSIVFLVTCGQFRYLIGGDVGGSNQSEYIDQESVLHNFFNTVYPVTWSYNRNVSVAGHVCGFKADHHGSQYSNNLSFIAGMTPAITIASTGNNTNWHLPHPDYLSNVSKIRPLSIWQSSDYNIANFGVYMTNLYDFPKGASRSVAVTLFKNKKGISFDFGNDSNTVKASYMIRVNTALAATKSAFQVFRMQPSGPTLMANYFCHSN